MYKALQPKHDVDRLYVSRLEGGRGLSSIKDSVVDVSRQRLAEGIEKCGEILIKATRNNTNDTRTIRTSIAWKQKWEEKQHYGHFKRLTNDISREKTWTWLKKENFKREIESLLRAAQNNVIRTNHIKKRIDKTQLNSKCRLCSDRDETINHIIKECITLA